MNGTKEIRQKRHKSGDVSLMQNGLTLTQLHSTRSIKQIYCEIKTDVKSMYYITFYEGTSDIVRRIDDEQYCTGRFISRIAEDTENSPMESVVIRMKFIYIHLSR